jgi:hypothetical protein
VSTVSAPKFVPVATVGAFRGDSALPPAEEWKSDRPAELAEGSPSSARMGRPGPDQGYAIKLANTFHGKLQLTEGEDEHDAIAGCLGVALKRASMFSRAPVIHDLRVAFNTFGYLTKAPADLVELRKARIEAVGHHYEIQREIADLVPEETLRMTPEAVARRVDGGNWKSLLAL